MNLKTQLGQMIMFGFKGTQPTEDVIRLVKEYKAGNIILFHYNIESASQLKQLCQTLRELITEETGHPPFIAIDQEGGVVSRVPSDAAKFPSAMAVSSTGNPENAFTAGLITAQELAEMGITMNMAPSMDINTNPNNPVIGVRSYGDTAETVTAYGVEALKGAMQGGTMPVIKHFPGHGDTEVDSHVGLPRVEKTFDELMQCELIPFVAGINAGAPCVMTSHILFPEIEKEELPATMSPAVLQGVLRQKLGFKGLIVSDCLEMDAVKEFYGTPEGYLLALRAGVDLPCVSHTASLVERSLNIAAEAAEKDEELRKIIEEGSARVVQSKQKWAAGGKAGTKVGSPEHLAAAKQMYNGSISRAGQNTKMPKVDENTLFAGSLAYRTTLASSPLDETESFAKELAERFNAKAIITPPNPSDEEIAEAVSQAAAGQTVVFGSYNGHINTGQIKLANAFAEKGCNLIAVALRNPYDLTDISEKAYKLAAFQYDENTFDAVENILRGNAPKGILSVNLGI